MTPQFILGPLVGGLSHDHVNLWARASRPATFHAWLGRKPDFSDAKLAGKSLPLNDATGCAGVAPMDKLKPETTYYYALRLDDSPPLKADGQFTTFPRPGQPRAFNFAFGSCFRPQGENSGAAFRALETRRQEDKLRFILLLGDQVYADAWEYNGIAKVAANLTDYRNVYTHVWSNPHFRALLKNLPAFMTLDDHEVDDDWRWSDARRRWASIPWWDQVVRWLKGRPPEEWYLPHHRVRDALQAYWEHQGMHAPAMTLPPELNYAGQYKLREQDPGSLAYTFTYGAAAFFVMDTRSMRVKGRSGKTMLGEGQWQALEDWLRAVKNDFQLKFLVTSCSALYSMWTDIPRDRWSGFPEERDRLLRFIGGNDIQGVYLLAGDLHSAHAISAECGPRRNPVRIWEFCSTPFEQDTNPLSRWMYIPILSGAVRKQKVHFVVTNNNFGVVRVEFPAQGQPQVRFDLHYEDKGEWKVKTAG